MSGLDRLFAGMRTAASALKAERVRLDTIAKNIANARTTRVPDTGEAYRREVVHFAPLIERVGAGRREIRGGKVAQITKDFSTPFEEVYDPTHPDANAQGVVYFPNVNTIKEMVDLITAVRAYEASIRVQENFERMAQRALRLAE